MKKFLKAVVITTVLSIITRILGFLLKIYISREIGAEALGFYQISLSAFFLLCSLVTSGLPLIISRKIAKNKQQEGKVVGAGLIICCSIALLVIAIILMFPSLFTSLWNQQKSITCLYVLLPAVLFTAIYVPFRGSLWGKKEFFYLGFIELIEQLVRFICCIIIFNIVLNFSGEVKASVTYTIACLASSIIAIIIFFKQGGSVQFKKGQIFPLIKESTPIAIVRIGTSMVTMLISIILPAMLAKTGVGLSTAVAEFGVVTGMVLPLLTIPGTLIGSIAVALLPELSGSNEEEIKNQINKSLSYSIIISLVLFPVFLVLGDNIGIWLYDNKLAGELLKIGSLLLLPLGVSQITSSILNSICKEKIGLLISAISSLCLIGSVVFLPKYLGIYSLVVGFCAMSIVSSILNLIAIKKYLTREPLKVLIKNLIMCIPACLFAQFVSGICVKTVQNTLLSIVIPSSISLGSLFILLITFNMIDFRMFLPKKS